MRDDYTHIEMVLDRSGSMATICDDTIGGVNTFITEQKAAPGLATFGLVLFDHDYIRINGGGDMRDVPLLTHQTFVPRGNTALLDAVGRSIRETGAFLAAKPEADRPRRVVFVIVTDGLENSSREATHDSVRAAIEHQREKYGWEFVFLGANFDAIAVGNQIGIRASNSMTYAANSVGVEAAFLSTSAVIAEARADPSRDIAYTDQDRADQAAAGA